MSTAPDLTTCRWLSAFLDSTPDHAVVLATPDGVIVAWLGAAERVLGYTAAEIVGQPLSRLFTPEDLKLGLDAQEIDLALRQGRSEDDRWHLRKNGSRFWASGVLSVVKDGDGTTIGLCKLLRDKTDTRIRVQLLEDRVGLRDAEIARQRNFYAATAHELRNPMMPIEAALTLLERPDAAQAHAKAIRILRNQLGLLNTLIDDLLKAEVGTAPVTPAKCRPVNLNDALREASDGFQDQAAAEGKTLLLVVPAVDIWVAADAARVQQMLLNLLVNALKYTRRGGRIGVSLTVEANMANIRIEDDGRGIAPDVLPHIFELFTREQRDDGVDGLGIGLAVVKELAELHGGNVEVRSPGQDQGSVFGLRLPLPAK